MNQKSSSRAHYPFELRPSDAWIGVVAGAIIWCACFALLYLSLWHIAWQQLELVVSVPLAAGVLLMQTMLYTGLFITAHDAMHGTACWKSPRLNAALGFSFMRGKGFSAGTPPTSSRCSPACACCSWA